MIQSLNLKNAMFQIRAANLLHCSYTSAIMSGDFGLFNSKLAHQVIHYCSILVPYSSILNWPIR